ncbi:MAG: inner rane transport protein ydiM [Bacillus sp. (in: firmicutes)]|jgi:MFS family permease|nr:inner rane transport protein ydiM [Bacillus sp. (in: firmicutes)]
MKNRYLPTAIVLYINYFVHGMGAIILAQNMKFLTGQLHTDNAGVAYVISALGIGRLIALFVSGALSDKFGRKPFVAIGMGVYAVFFVGILFSPSVEVAFIFAIMAGIANSLLDSGTYPALMESFPKTAGTANVIIKAFISGGQFALPMIIGFIINHDMYYGISFLIPVAIFVLNGIFLAKMPFPSHIKDGNSKDSASTETIFASKPKFWIEGLCIILIGYTATATFYLIQVWLPTYGQDVVGMAEVTALKLISYYSLGSLASVFLTSYLVKSLVKPVTIVFIYPLISFITLIAIWQIQTPTMVVIGAAVIGFSAAGGVLQLALTVMTEFFNQSKGKITGIVYTASSLASFTIPVVTGIISRTSVENIIVFDAGIAFVGTLLAIVVNVRYRKVFKKETNQVKMSA